MDYPKTADELLALPQGEVAGDYVAYFLPEDMVLGCADGMGNWWNLQQRKDKIFVKVRR